MFTGIVQATCEVVSINNATGLKTFEIAMTPELTQGLVTGASVANNGVCLTATKILNDKVFFDVMEETLAVTNLGNTNVGDRINIERSLTFGSEIGGHILSGHVHTLATVKAVSNTDEHYNIELQVNPQWMNYIFYKGFVGINGCSLTVGKLTDNGFMLHLIPETLKLTNLDDCTVGSRINIEIDSQTQVIVDTVERILANKQLA
ncbi:MULTISPECIES: riboflavin synthase subunit alpha [Shewanella]|uniref:Riboflavin synthase n=1 Tax=Shewanella psychromarinicola TaxID=2487742 RepID=A0A3N4DZ75_9GAMM|nr:riboflavin synthase subunit alpha [Shewanella psychromarinicola]AZG36216.1 riboflavin synthase subunit alpha [Shewanella psychromarinicola]MCL1083826.1 riboflavin synthase subunit alpha [Shewanella psychromarinicola]RPA22714.1 riboflavin synthase subunit alpha [Shewanella psychromarinicola]